MDDRNREIHRVDNIGSAMWNNDKGLPLKKLWCGQKIVFGVNPNNSLQGYGQYPIKHFLTIANTRSGKGTTQIIANLLHYKGSVVVIDPKGENAYLTAKRRREIGQKTYILDPWGEVNRRYGEKSGEFEEIATFNPLSLLDKESPHFMDDLAYISDALIINEGKDPHWDNSARELVSGLIAYVVEKQGKASHLGMVRQLLSLSPAALADVAKKAQKLGFDNIAARKLARFTGESKELGSVISTATTQTAFLDNPMLSKNMETNSFSFMDLTEKKATIYLVLPVDKLMTYGRWLRLMISLGIRTISRNIKQLENPVLFILDEFGTIGKLSAVSQAVGLMAGLQMCVWPFVQDLTQLKRDYPQDWETFIGNAQAISILEVMDQTTAAYISEMLGKATIVKLCDNTKKRRELGEVPKDFFSHVADRQYQRALMLPDEVRRMNKNLGILISKGDPLLYKKENYYESSFHQNKARPNPYYKS